MTAPAPNSASNSTPSFTTHEILEATAFVMLSSIDSLTGARRDQRIVGVRRAFIATAYAYGKHRSMVARILKRDRTSVYHQEKIIARMGQHAKAALDLDVYRIQMELRRRAQSNCATRSNLKPKTNQGNDHHDTR